MVTSMVWVSINRVTCKIDFTTIPYSGLSNDIVLVRIQQNNKNNKGN